LGGSTTIFSIHTGAWWNVLGAIQDGFGGGTYSQVEVKSGCSSATYVGKHGGKATPGMGGGTCGTQSSRASKGWAIALQKGVTTEKPTKAVKKRLKGGAGLATAWAAVQQHGVQCNHQQLAQKLICGSSVPFCFF